MSDMGGGDRIIGIGFDLAVGVMTYIMVDELIPVAHEYCFINHKHFISTGLLTGMIFGHLLSLVFNV